MNPFLSALFAATLLIFTHSVRAMTFNLPAAGDDLIGEVNSLNSRYDDTLSNIARMHNLGFLEIKEANPGVDPWLPGVGTRIVLPMQFILPPGPREGIVINLAELRLYYYPADADKVITYPLGIGREGWSTPTGYSRITRKTRNPSWHPPASIREEAAAEGKILPVVVKPGPDNPLGQYALNLSLASYLIHGTNKPYGVGMRVSHGCLRLYPEDIEELFSLVKVGVPVRIVNLPYKAGWSNGRLYVEAHPPLSEQVKKGQNLTPMVQAVLNVLKDKMIKPDWEVMRLAAVNKLGIPTPLPLQQRANVGGDQWELSHRLKQQGLKGLRGD